VIHDVSSLFYLVTGILAFLKPWTFAFLQYRLASLDYTFITPSAWKVSFGPHQALSPLVHSGAFFLQVMIGPVLASFGSTSCLPD